MKHRTTFCYSFYCSGHDPAIAIHEIADFFQYLENGRLVSFVPKALPFKHSSGMTNAARVRAVIRFIGYLIATYVSPYYRNETPKELSRHASRLNTRLLICKEEFKTLKKGNQQYYSRVIQGFRSMTDDMVKNVYRIVVPSSKNKHSVLNPFPSGFIQFRNYLIMRLMLNYGLRVGELLLLECASVKTNIKGDKLREMKKNIENFDAFIAEQKAWFEEHLAVDFAESWDSLVWICGNKGSGWLRGNGVNALRFDEINRLKGIDDRHTVSDTYQLFMKAMLVLVYRGRNRSISPAVAVATLVILKRWYCALIKITGQTHPIYLTTDVVRSAMDTLSAASRPGDSNIANYKGRCVKIQKLVNHHAFTLVALQYVSDVRYTNQTNLTRKARETKRGLLVTHLHETIKQRIPLSAQSKNASPFRAGYILIFSIVISCHYYPAFKA